MHPAVLRYRDLHVGNAETEGHPIPRFAAAAMGDRVFILGHHYQRDEVIQFADVTGDMTNMLTKHGALPKRRADDCNYEFQSMDRAFKTQIRPHIDLEMAKRVFDTAWFPPPLRRPDPPAPALAAAPGP